MAIVFGLRQTFFTYYKSQEEKYYEQLTEIYDYFSCIVILKIYQNLQSDYSFYLMDIRFNNKINFIINLNWWQS